MDKPSQSSSFSRNLTSEQKASILDRIAEEFPLLINVLDLRVQQYVYVSPAWEELSSLPTATWFASPLAWIDVIHPDDRPHTFRLAETGTKGTVASGDVRILHRDGSIHSIHGWLTPLCDAEGTPTHMIGVCEDITARTRVEEKLRETHLKQEQELRSRTIELQKTSDALERALAESQNTHREMETGLSYYRTLTPREKEVFDFVVRGSTNPEIADLLEVSQATVKAHRGKVMKKMCVDSVAELAVLAVRSGLLSDDKV